MAVEGRGTGHVTRDAASKWQVIAALGVTQIIGYGSVFYSFSPLMQPLQRALGADKSVVVGHSRWPCSRRRPARSWWAGRSIAAEAGP